METESDFVKAYLKWLSIVFGLGIEDKFSDGDISEALHLLSTRKALHVDKVKNSDISEALHL